MTSKLEPKKRDLNVLSENDRSLAQDNWRCLSQIDTLTDVQDGFRETLRLLAYRVMGNPAARMNLYIIAQLSEMGTGFSSTFENGGTQSDRRDDVFLWFTSFGGGFKIRLRGDLLTLIGEDGRGIVGIRTIPLHDRARVSTRTEICGTIDELFGEWWGS
jgi:hypothetical protein